MKLIDFLKGSPTPLIRRGKGDTRKEETIQALMEIWGVSEEDSNSIFNLIFQEITDMRDYRVDGLPPLEAL